MPDMFGNHLKSMVLRVSISFRVTPSKAKSMCSFCRRFFIWELDTLRHCGYSGYSWGLKLEALGSYVTCHSWKSVQVISKEIRSTYWDISESWIPVNFYLIDDRALRVVVLSCSQDPVRFYIIGVPSSWKSTSRSTRKPISHAIRLGKCQCRVLNTGKSRRSNFYLIDVRVLRVVALSCSQWDFI
jgi:hypothetical protein